MCARVELKKSVWRKLDYPLQPKNQRMSLVVRGTRGCEVRDGRAREKYDTPTPSVTNARYTQEERLLSGEGGRVVKWSAGL
jgi:hypothetical protein